MNGENESPALVVLMGIVFPVFLALVVVCNLIAWRVYWPGGRFHQGPHVYSDGWHVVGTVIIKLAIAGGCVCWFWLASREPTEHLAWPGSCLAVVVGVTGFIVFLIGFFV